MLRWIGEAHSIALGYEATRESSVGASTEFALFGDGPNSNLAVAEGIDRAMVARATWGARTLSPFTARLSHRIAGGGLAGDFDYTRSDAVVDLRHFVGRFEIDTSLTYARTTGDAPIQRLADIGGLTGVRGYPRRTHVGESSLSLRAELPIPYDLLRRSRIPLLKRLGLQFVPWADGARVYNGGSDEWIQSYGLGVQKFLGGFGRGANLRLDIAVPVGPQRPGDVVFYLGFAGN